MYLELFFLTQEFSKNDFRFEQKSKNTFFSSKAILKIKRSPAMSIDSDFFIGIRIANIAVEDQWPVDTGRADAGNGRVSSGSSNYPTSAGRLKE